MNISHGPNVSCFSSSSARNTLRDRDLGLIFIFLLSEHRKKKKYPWVFSIMVLIKLSALSLVFKAIAHQVSCNVKGRSVAFVGGWVGRVASPHLPQSTRWYRGMFAFGEPMFLLFLFGLLFQYCLKKKKTLIVAVQGGRSVKMCLPHHSESCKCNG